MSHKNADSPLATRKREPRIPVAAKIGAATMAMLLLGGGAAYAATDSPNPSHTVTLDNQIGNVSQFQVVWYTPDGRSHVDRSDPLTFGHGYTVTVPGDASNIDVQLSNEITWAPIGKFEYPTLTTNLTVHSAGSAWFPRVWVTEG